MSELDVEQLNTVDMEVEEPAEIEMSSEDVRIIQAVSPTVNVERIEGGTQITITDVNGTHTSNVYDGPQGDTGPQGETGETGATGATPVISIGTVSTLEPGSSATASMDTTDPENPVLSMGIPEGAKGDTGEKGDKGDKGDPGDPTTSTASDIAMSSSDPTKIANVIASHAGNMAAAYDSTATYDVGDRCMYANVLYECTTAISTAEDFDPTHWAAVTVDELITERETADASQNAAIGKNEEAMAIVATGNTHAAITANQYVYVKGHDTLTEGLYTNTSGYTIAANTTLSTSNLTAVSGGGLNDLNSNIAKKLSGVSFVTFQTGTGASVTLNLPQAFRGLLFSSSAYGSNAGVFNIISNNAGTTSASSIAGGSDITFGTSVNSKLTVSSSNWTMYALIAINGTVTIAS